MKLQFGVEMKEDDAADYVAWLDGLWLSRLIGAREAKPELTIGILLWPGFPLMSLTGLIESLRHAADFADQSRPLYCRWSIMGAPATASCGVVVQPDAGYLNPTEFDYVAVIGGLMRQMNEAPPRHRDYVRVVAAAGVPLIGLCTGVFVLAREGLLTGSRAAVHPFHAEEFRLAFPRVPISTREDFLIDGARITVPGGVSVLSLMTALIRRHCGADRAAKVVHQLCLVERRSATAFDEVRATEHREVPDGRIQRAVVLIESRKGKDVTPEQVAMAVGLSGRQFTRLFREHLKRTPKRFILDTRLRYARFLVESGKQSMTEIAFETGFADCAHFTTSFRARYGAAPRSLRAGKAARGAGDEARLSVSVA